MDLISIKNELIEYGKLMADKNLSPGVSGNLSIRVEDKVLITTSGSANGFLSADDLVLIDFSGNVIDGNKKASSEKMLHIEFYKRRPDINCVMHVHSPNLTAFANANIALDVPLMPEIVFYFDKIPLADYGLPSSLDLVNKTSKFFDKYDAVLMANHGFIIGGKNIKDTYLKLDLAESYAQTVINTNILSKPIPLNEEQVREIYQLKSK